MTVRILPRALAELEAWIDQIRQDKPRAAAEFAAQVFAAIEMRHDDELRVLRIYHQARRPLSR